MNQKSGFWFINQDYGLWAFASLTQSTNLLGKIPDFLKDTAGE
jgi:hypothetical protein